MSETDKKTESIPGHVAIIMDGNRRWAKKRGLSTAQGHQEGYKRFKQVVDSLFDKGVQYVTVYAFSTENWKRSQDEVEAVMNLARYVIDKEIDKYRDRDVRVNVIGRSLDYPDDIAIKVRESKCKALDLDSHYFGGDEMAKLVNKYE